MDLPNHSCWKPLDLDNLTRCESEFQDIIADDVDPTRRQVEISYWIFRRPSEREDFRVGHAYRQPVRDRVVDYPQWRLAWRHAFRFRKRWRHSTGRLRRAVSNAGLKD